MSLRHTRYYEIDEPGFEKGNQNTHVESATLEIRPKDQDGRKGFQISTNAEMGPGKERTVHGFVDYETAEELHSELGEMLDDI